MEILIHLHSTILILILIKQINQEKSLVNLHSTILILIHNYHLLHFLVYFDLHSTILILILICYTLLVVYHNYLHSTILILIQIYPQPSYSNPFVLLFCRPIKILPYISIFCHIFFENTLMPSFLSSVVVLYFLHHWRSTDIFGHIVSSNYISLL